MDRQTVRVALVAVLTIVALSAAAATLDTAEPTGGGLGPGSDGDEGFSDSEGGSLFGFDETGDGPVFGGQLPRLGACVSFLTSIEFFLLVGLVTLVAGYLIARRYDVLVAFAFVVAWGMPGFIVWLFLATCPAPAPSEETGLLPGPLNASMPRGGGMLGQQQGSTPVPPSVALLAFLGLVLVVAVAAILRSTDDEAVVPEAPGTDLDDEQRMAEIGRVAGEAADSIAGAGDLENEVYRAWRRMVGLLAVENPTATTPGEFARAAERAGMARRDVDELTELFEAVRYGGEPSTPDRERRAVDALRRIERTYADDSDRGGWGNGGEDR